MTMRPILIGVILAAGLSGAAPSAFAAKDAARQRAQTLCTEDATRLCGDTLGDDAATAQCMKGKRAQLSPACRKASDALR